MTPIYYEEFSGYELDTQDIYLALSSHWGSFNPSLLLQFRENLETLLYNKKKITTAFNPIHWEHHRHYVLHYRQHIEDIYLEGSRNVFFPDFFIKGTPHPTTELYGSLSDNQRVQIAYSGEDNERANYASVLPDNKKDLEKRNGAVFSKNASDKEDVNHWFEWKYDIYQLDQPCELSYEDDREAFGYFFAWRLGISDLIDLRPFLKYHFECSFDGKKSEFEEYVSLLMRKYENIIVNPYTREQVKASLVGLVEKTEKDLGDTEESNDMKEWKGNLSEKYYIIPKKLKERRNGDNYTSLTQEQTVALFHFLREERIILLMSE